MKKIVAASAIALLMAAGIANSEIIEVPEEPNGKKVKICHKGNVISVSVNAYLAHKAHGDYVLNGKNGNGRACLISEK